MKSDFDVAAGSVIGRDHRLDGKNNQDAFHIVSAERLTVAVVCDGCGSSPHSEVGAKIGAAMTAESLARHARRLSHLGVTALLERARLDVLAHLRVLACQMNDSLSRVVSDYFLFTVVGALLTPGSSTFFSIGDGVIVVNGEALRIGPFPGNEPPYLAYALLTESSSESLKFQMHRLMPTIEVHSLLIGTDGVAHLMEAAERNVPGRTEKVGHISQFWQDDHYLRNPDMIRRRLALVNRPVTKADWASQRIHKENGLLPDDTTLVVMRRK